MSFHTKQGWSTESLCISAPLWIREALSTVFIGPLFLRAAVSSVCVSLLSVVPPGGAVQLVSVQLLK